jgi:glyoxylase I family protein
MRLPLLCFLIALGGCLSPANAGRPAAAGPPAQPRASVRYQVADVERAATFYTQHLGFALEQRTGTAFASVTLDNLRLILGGPGSSGARPMPDGRKQEPGGWNRIVLYVGDLEARIEVLKRAGVHFRNTVEVGPGGSQILLDDPDGNPIELHQAPSDPR